MSKTITLLTSGTLGDVLPYIALGKGLIEAGYNVRVAAPRGFANLIQNHHISFSPFDGNPTDLMIEQGDSTPFTLGAVSAHLGMASCRAQELASATYGEGRGALEEVLEAGGGDGTCVASTCEGGVLAGAACGGDDDCSMEGALEATLPCLKAAASHHED